MIKNLHKTFKKLAAEAYFHEGLKRKKRRKEIKKEISKIFRKVILEEKILRLFLLQLSYL